MLAERLGWTTRGLDSMMDDEARETWLRWRQRPEPPAVKAWRDFARISDGRRGWLSGHLLLLWSSARWPGRLPADRVLYHARSAVMLSPDSRGVRLLAGDAVSLCGLEANRMDWWQEGVRLMRQGMGWQFREQGQASGPQLSAPSIPQSQSPLRKVGA